MIGRVLDHLHVEVDPGPLELRLEHLRRVSISGSWDWITLMVTPFGYPASASSCLGFVDVVRRAGRCRR